MNFAVEAGKVVNLAEFDALTQKLIDENGLQFRSECSVRTLTTLRGRFARGEDVYKAETATLIEDLGISPSEQEELEVLREFPKKEKTTPKVKAPSLESLKLWEVEGISRRLWYYRRKAEREVKARQEQTRRLFMEIVIERIVNKLYASVVYDCTARTHIMRGMRGMRGDEGVCMCESQGGMISGLGGLIFRVQRVRVRVQRVRDVAFVSAVKAITALVEKTGMKHTALVEKTGMKHTALKADRTVNRVQRVRKEGGLK